MTLFTLVHRWLPWGLDRDRFDEHFNSIRRATPLPDKQFEEAAARIRTLVEELYTNGNQDSIFKGSWYAKYLLEEMKAADPTSRATSLDAIKAVAQADVNISDEWASHLRGRLRTLIEMIA